MGGESDPSRLAHLAKAQLRGKIRRLRLALEADPGASSIHHLEFLEGKIFIIEKELRRRSQPCEEAIQFWMTIPGVRWRIAVTLVAEIGVDMKQFPSAAQLASWAGVCPGNNEALSEDRSEPAPPSLTPGDQMQRVRG